MKKRIAVKKHVAKNNNLETYRKKLVQSNEELIKNCITHIRSIGGEIKFSTVSRVSYGLAAEAKNGQKGLTLAGISTSPVYRLLVEQAQADTSMHQVEHQGKVHRHSPGDMRLKLYALQSDNVKLKQEKRTLELKLNEVSPQIETVRPIRDEIIENSNELKIIANSLVTRLLELEIAYIDTKDETIKLLHYESVLVSKDALNKFFKKELDNAKL